MGYECAFCQSKLVKRKGPFGELYGCINYPDCTYTMNVEKVSGYERINQETYAGQSGKDYGVCKNCGGKDYLSEMKYCVNCQMSYDKIMND